VYVCGLLTCGMRVFSTLNRRWSEASRQSEKSLIALLPPPQAGEGNVLILVCLFTSTITRKVVLAFS